MADLKITSEQLKNYLGTGLVVTMRSVADVNHGLDTLIGIYEEREDGDEIFVRDYRNNPYEYKVRRAVPHCYRLSDLDKYIPELGLVPAKELAKLITQAGFDHEKIESIRQENNTIICEYKASSHPSGLGPVVKPFFDIDIDEDFGFSLGVIRVQDGESTEDYSCTGNIWLMYQRLFEWHFWPFGEEYFNQGLVIDKRKEASHA